MLAAPNRLDRGPCRPVISDVVTCDIARPASRSNPAGRASDPAIDAQIPFEAVAVMDVIGVDIATSTEPPLTATSPQCS
jgi:hypothetical protein